MWGDGSRTSRASRVVPTESLDRGRRRGDLSLCAGALVFRCARRVVLGSVRRWDGWLLHPRGWCWLPLSVLAGHRGWCCVHSHMSARTRLFGVALACARG